MTPEELEEKARLEEEASDMDPPFAPAQGSDDMSDTHPSTDSNFDDDELYEEGIAGAAEAGEPNSHNDVVGYVSPDEHEEV